MDLNSDKSQKTVEALTFPINYNDPTAVDPPSWVHFSTQSQISQFLTSKGTTNFKHLMACWGSLPDVVAHDITFNLAAGIHRPRSGDSAATAAFVLSNKTFVGYCSVKIAGAAPSLYTQVVASQSITGLSSDILDPWAEVSGTPFAGQNLRGYYAVFNTGQVSVIHQNTDSKVRCIDELSPTPTSFFVGKPATVLRNSLNDTSALNGTSLLMLMASNPDMGPILEFDDILLDEFGAWWGTQIASGVPFFNRVLVDHAYEADTFGLDVHNTRALSVYWVNLIAGFSSQSFSVRGCGFAAVPQDPQPFVWWGLYWSTVYLAKSYFGGTGGAELENGAWLLLMNAVFDAGTRGIWLFGNCRIGNQDQYFNGQRSVIRGCLGPGLTLEDGSGWDPNLAGSVLMFEQCEDSCVVLGPRARLRNGYAPMHLINGPAGGNLGVGIEFRGPGALAVLDGNTNVSGSFGEVMMADGDLWTYTDISANDPVVDSHQNLVNIPAGR